LGHYAGLVSARGLFLFLTAGVIWGTPYFFIALALEGFSTPSIVWIRVTIGTLVLLPIAIHRRALRPALKAWPWVLAFAVGEMVIPWALITEAEQSISSSLAGLLITTVPFIAAFVIGLMGDRSAWHPMTVLGLVLGFSGVVALVGIDAFAGRIELLPVIMMIGAAIGYAVAPIVADRKLADIPTMGVITLSMAMVSVIYAIPALNVLPRQWAALETPSPTVAVGYLGLVASALGFIVFFALIKEVGPGRATLITYVNVVVAFLLGVLFLDEPLTTGFMVGFPLIVVGSYLASQRRDVYVSKKKRQKTVTGEIGIPDQL
jgi:drug/metabolite transporter (DMT)-like permease